MTFYIFLLACGAAASTGIFFQPGQWYESRQTRFHAAQLAVSSRLDDYLPVARLGWVSVDPDT